MLPYLKKDSDLAPPFKFVEFMKIYQVKVKEIVDPVPDRIYSRMKEKRSTSTDLVNYSERF